MSGKEESFSNFGTAEFRAPLVIKFGWGVLTATLPEVLRETGIERPLLVTDPTVGKLAPVVRAIEEISSSGVRFAGIFDGIPHEPTTREVDAAVAAVVHARADGIVAIGGGAVIDTAKAASMLAANGGPLSTYFGANRFPSSGIPLVAVPTTAGTGSEVTRFTVITDPETHAKLLITERKMIPRAAIVDPALTVTAPPEVTANPGIDALTHAIEAYVSRKANPVSDTLALSAIRRMAWSLPRAFADGEDRAARTGAALGALEAGLAFSNASVALVHGMARPLGVAFGVPHGASNAMLLPTVTAFSMPAAPHRYMEIANAMGVDVEGLDDLTAARRGLEAIEALCREVKIPTLGAYGIDRQMLEQASPKMASDAIASGSPGNNPRHATEEEIIALYLQAY